MKLPSLTFKKSEHLRIGILCLLLGLFYTQAGAIFPWALLGVFLSGVFLVFSKKFFWVCLLLVFLGSTYSSLYFRNLESSSLKPLWNQTIKINGWVSGFPDEREKNIRVFIEGNISFKNQTQNGKILLIVPPKTNISYGDSVSVFGKITEPKTFSGFDYFSYLQRFGVSGIIRTPIEFTIDSQNKKGFSLLLWGSDIRKKLRNNLERTLPFAHGKIAMGILLGVKNELPKNIQSSFKRSGLMHILVVSGFNVSVVILLVAFLLRKFGHRIVFLGTILILFFFLTLTGLDPPVLRAVLMGGLTAWALGMGRKTDPRNILYLSILLISLANPLILQTDIGFFLSIFATFGILFGTEFFEKKFSFLPEFLRTMLAVTLSAQLAVSSLLIVFFGEIPVVGLFSNLFTEPLIPFTMFFSFLVIVFGGLPLFIAKIISIPAIIFLELIILIAKFFGYIDPLIIPSFIGKILLGLTLSFFLFKSFQRTSSEEILTGQK